MTGFTPTCGKPVASPVREAFVKVRPPPATRGCRFSEVPPTSSSNGALGAGGDAAEKIV